MMGSGIKEQGLMRLENEVKSKFDVIKAIHQ